MISIIKCKLTSKNRVFSILVGVSCNGSGFITSSHETHRRCTSQNRKTNSQATCRRPQQHTCHVCHERRRTQVYGRQLGSAPPESRRFCDPWRVYMEG